MENAIRLVLGTMVFTLLCVSLVIQLRQRKGGRDQDASQNEAAEARAAGRQRAGRSSAARSAPCGPSWTVTPAA